MTSSDGTVSTGFGVRVASHCILDEINNGGQKNLVFCPLSLHIALNMVASASTGRTLEQFLHFLESESITDLNARSSLFTELATNGEGGGPIISLANGIWVHHRYPMKPSFKQLIEDVYMAKAESVDFNRGDQVTNEINSWARKASRGHIDPFLPHGFVTKDAVLLLASAIYFKATWDNEFDSSNTKDEDFHLLNGQTVRLPFMKMHGDDHFYGSFESFKLLKMEYKNDKLGGKKFAMYIFLPHEKDGLHELVEKFHSDPRFLLENREVKQVGLSKLWLPKMKYEYELNGNETIKELGLDLPFDMKEAEIKEMVENRDGGVSISKVIQKAYIEVNEEEDTIAIGLIAERRTGRLRGNYISPPPKPSFVADHPFLFMIKEEVSDIILFVGAALNPSGKGAGKKRKMRVSKEKKKKKTKQKD